MADSGKPWARLVNLGSTEEIIEIVGTSFTIGRLPGIKICNTNGTQVDGTKVKQKKADLNHGDEIHIVFKKNSTESNVAYAFELLDKKLSDTFEATQEYDEVEEVDADPDEPLRKHPKLDAEATKDTAGRGTLGTRQVDEIEETLLCCICQELLYDCVSLQPCMHTFCAGCFSQWMRTSKACPTCRKKATSVAQNHILRNLIEIYLKSNPNKQRPRDELDVLDENNTIKQPVMVLKDWRPDGMDSDESYDESEDSYNSDDGGAAAAAPIHLPVNMNVPVCRQCPGYNASRAGYPVPPTPQSADDFQCTPGTQPHLVCFCCMELFPDRRNTPGTAVVTCDICAGHFCNLYWRCSNTGCQGCLSKLKDMNLDDSALDNLLLQNLTESNILKEYLRDKSLTVKDIVQETSSKLDTGEFVLNNDFNCNFTGKNVKSNSIICYRCGLKALRQLAYFFRKNIPSADLPAEVRRKPDCYWGKYCRTQKKPGHAQKLNHICEQTRFTS
ncbi:E3 ubiquitin-protein ligase CHFR-like isoform X2 [Watersipora subatra]|uniref:E3 ubiquitin-protein ligase CHFR-like isoform X2 n=1 Tax=Watersipora subatra TaxID=2589382 RepID=UPI00355B29E7